MGGRYEVRLKKYEATSYYFQKLLPALVFWFRNRKRVLYVKYYRF